MSFHAANPASFSHQSPCPVESPTKSLSTRNYGGQLRPSYGGHARSNRAAITATFRSQYADENFALERVYRYVSRLLLSHSFGAFRRPPALGLLLRIARSFGVSVPPKTSLRTTAQNALKLLSGPSQKADLRHLGAGPAR